MRTERELIEKYKSVPYVHKGRSMEGLDCGGFLVFWYKDLGFDIFFLHDYDRSDKWENESLFLKYYHKEWVPVKIPGLYDVVLFNGFEGIPTHAGIALSNNRFAHIHHAGFCINKLTHPSIKRRIQGFYHLKERDL